MNDEMAVFQSVVLFCTTPLDMLLELGRKYECQQNHKYLVKKTLDQQFNNGVRFVASIP